MGVKVGDTVSCTNCGGNGYRNQHLDGSRAVPVLCSMCVGEGTQVVQTFSVSTQEGPAHPEIASGQLAQQQATCGHARRGSCQQCS